MTREIKVLDKGFVQYVDHFGSDQRIVEAARTSYNGHSKGKTKDKKLLFYLYKNKHTSPFQFANLTFKLKLPIFVARQLFRHRTAQINEMSLRYTEAIDEFYVPEKWRRQDTKNKQGSIESEDCSFLVHDDFGNIYEGHKEISSLLEDQCLKMFEFYKALLASGIAREMARMVLPLNTYTMCYFSMDLHNFLHLIRLRDESHAQWEIQEYARAMKEIAKECFPWAMEAFERFSWELKEND